MKPMRSVRCAGFLPRSSKALFWLMNAQCRRSRPPRSRPGMPSRGFSPGSSEFLGLHCPRHGRASSHIARRWQTLRRCRQRLPRVLWRKASCMVQARGFIRRNGIAASPSAGCRRGCGANLASSLVRASNGPQSERAGGCRESIECCPRRFDSSVRGMRHEHGLQNEIQARSWAGTIASGSVSRGCHFATMPGWYDWIAHEWPISEIRSMSGGWDIRPLLQALASTIGYSLSDDNVTHFTAIDLNIVKELQSGGSQ